RGIVRMPYLPLSSSISNVVAIELERGK
ncbi:hypothetical protein LCGC14_3151440, partial [marine sediment metagenome]